MSLSRLFIVCFALCKLTLPAYAQSAISFTALPQSFQLYGRGSTNQATVPVSGTATSVYSQVSLQVQRDNKPFWFQRQSLQFTGAQTASFSFAPILKADPVEYTFRIYGYKSARDSTLVVERTRVVCGDVLILYGQSNALALNDLDNYDVDDRLLRNFTYPFQSTDIPNSLAWSPAKQPYASVGGLGLWLQKLLLARSGVPTCVINGSQGGASLVQLDDRNASNPTDLNTFYGRLLYRVQRSGLLEQATSIIWKQGEAEAGSSTIGYEAQLRGLLAHWQEDYPALRKVYLSQINILADPVKSAGDLREVQRRSKQWSPLIETIATVGTYYYDGVHYTRPGNQQIATELSRQIARDFYGSTDTVQIDSPDIYKAYYNRNRDTLTLVFDDNQQLVWPKDSVLTSAKDGSRYTRRMTDYIYLDGQAGRVQSGAAEQNRIILALTQPTTSQTVTYLPSFFSDEHSAFYDGPQLTNRRDMRAFSFSDFPIAVALPTTLLLTANANSDQQITVSWSADTLSTGSQFLLERAPVGSTQFQVIARLPLAITQYEDRDFSGPAATYAYTYRIRLVSPVAESAYSNAVTATLLVLALTPFESTQWRVYPNPAATTLTVEMLDKNLGFLSHLNLTTAQGQTVLNQSASDSKATLSVHALPAGPYYLTITTQTGELRTTQVLIHY